MSVVTVWYAHGAKKRKIAKYIKYLKPPKGDKVVRWFAGLWFWGVLLCVRILVEHLGNSNRIKSNRIFVVGLCSLWNIRSHTLFRVLGLKRRKDNSASVTNPESLIREAFGIILICPQGLVSIFHYWRNMSSGTRFASKIKLTFSIFVANDRRRRRI